MMGCLLLPIVFVVIWICVFFILSILGVEDPGNIALFLSVVTAIAAAGVSIFQAVTEEKEKQEEEANKKICPFCKEDIKQHAVVCRHCGRDLE